MPFVLCLGRTALYERTLYMLYKYSNEFQSEWNFFIGRDFIFL